MPQHTYQSLRALAQQASLLAAHLRSAASKAAMTDDRWTDAQASAALTEARGALHEVEKGLWPLATALCEQCEADVAAEQEVAEQAAKMAEVSARPLVDTVTGEVHPPVAPRNEAPWGPWDLITLAHACDDAFAATANQPYDVQSVFREAAATARAIVSGELAQVGNVALVERYADITERVMAGEPLAEVRKDSDQGQALLARLERSGVTVAGLNDDESSADHVSAHDQRYFDEVASRFAGDPEFMRREEAELRQAEAEKADADEVAAADPAAREGDQRFLDSLEQAKADGLLVTPRLESERLHVV